MVLLIGFINIKQSKRPPRHHAEPHAANARKGQRCKHPRPLKTGMLSFYGTVNGRSPSVGNSPVGPAAVDGCGRNRKRMKKPVESDE